MTGKFLFCFEVFLFWFCYRKFCELTLCFIRTVNKLQLTDLSFIYYSSISLSCIDVLLKLNFLY